MVMSPAAEMRDSGASAVRDLGPLAWVLDETRRSIEAASKSLKRFARETDAARGIDLGSVDASPLRMARQQLHQVAGALDMVDQSVAALMVRGMEGAVQQFVQRPDKCTEETAQALERAGFALMEYLEAQMGSHPRSAVGLFPQYRRVQELAGADRIHPADLWSVPWSWADPVVPASAQPLSYDPEVRHRLDQRVLKILRHPAAHAADELAVISLSLAAGQMQRQATVFWLLSAGFFEALGRGLIVKDVYAKRAASRILMQYTSLARGGQVVSERLAHDLLFFCSQARFDADANTPALQAVRKAWSLDAQQATSYEQAMFGLYDPAILAQARRRIESVKENWSALTGGDLARMKACVDQFSLVAESLDKLHEQGSVLGEVLNRVAQQTAQSGRPPGPELAMETATAVLFLEASFADFHPGDAMFSTRLAQLAARLDAVRAGASAPPLEPWMEELYRNVSDRQTMGTVVGELRTTLGEVEHLLDQFFRQPADRSTLVSVPGLMGQMRGVLSVLGLDQAALAVGRMRDLVDELLAAQPDTKLADSAPSFEKLGDTLGALGFQIDMLSYQPVLARKLFVYDADAGELRYRSGRAATQVTTEQNSVASATTDIDLLLDAGTELTVPTSGPGSLVDESLPSETISGQLDEIATMAALAEQRALADAAQRAADAARRHDEAGLSGALDALQALTAASTPQPTSTTVEGGGADDDDLQAIFLEEAQQVMDTGCEVVQALLTAPGDMELQTALRRAFHTLKGSSRMVGLTEFGEAAWAMEQLFNAWLPEQKPVTEDMRGLALEALQGLHAWTEAIAGRNDHGWTSAPFRQAADALRLSGQRVSLSCWPDAQVVVDAGAGHADVVGDGAAPAEQPHEVSSESIPAVQPAPPGERGLPDPQVPELAEGVVEVDATPADVASELEQQPAIELTELNLDAGDDPDAGSGLEVIDLSVSRWGPISETPKPQGLASGEPTQPPVELELPSAVDVQMPVAFWPATETVESIPPVGGMVGDEAALPEATLVSPEGLSAPQEGAEDGQTADVAAQDAELYRQIGDLRVSTALYNVYLNEADEWSRQLATDLSEWALELDRPVPDAAVARAHSLAGSSATVGFAALSELARAVEHALQRLVGQSRGTTEQAQCLNEAAQDIRRVLHQFAAGMLKTPNPDILAAVQALEPVVAGDEVAPALAQASASTWMDLAETVPLSSTKDEAQPPVVTRDSLQSLRALGDDIDVADVIDPDLFPIFEEEAEELLPQMGTALRRWVAHPDDREARAQALRALHTLKGSARLAGALRLGELAHRTESAVETLGLDQLVSADLEPLLDHFDELQAGFRRLQAGEQGVETSQVASVPDVATAEDARPAEEPSAEAGQGESRVVVPTVTRGDIASPAALSLVSARAAASQAVRVRSQLLDRLVMQAGEVATSRARLEAEIGQLRGLLGELTGNLDRLRGQLRDVELQAETQMQSRLALSRDAQQNFDPLEFDRFTRMQELTRMMAESVNDVATVQRSLQRAVEGSEDNLAAQARQSRELQRELLRTRMVEFDSIAERLYRVVRQASKETGKQVRLDIVGGATEIDRGILERMTPAFEHLVRNCVVHGIEPQAERSARGKEATGLISIQLQQAGNDVSVAFRDDGAGLNLSRIRERALQLGIVAADRELSDAEVANLVFMPGFSTASEVTELAGRGVGMDVVRSEVQALGGRIETQTTEGQGAAFRLVLPLTTAVTHVVMLRCGALAIGVPSNVVEIVQRASAKDLSRAYETGHYRYGDESLLFFWLGALLQDSPHSSEPPGRTLPVVVLRSADQRVAVHVDEVLGNQEVVVKALGPQLSGLPGLVAITALASGAVALIYNPVALASVYGVQARAMVELPQAAPAEVPVPQGPVPTPALAPSGIPLVLVVDDSITVRRVTQRLLQREGYRVALAADGLQGLERLQAERPAVVLSDIEMPRMDGFDFVRNIRADEALRDLPVIMITSRIAEKHREHARELGVDHYLGKPYSEDELLGLIRNYTRAAASVGAA